MYFGELMTTKQPLFVVVVRCCKALLFKMLFRVGIDLLEACKQVDHGLIVEPAQSTLN